MECNEEHMWIFDYNALIAVCVLFLTFSIIVYSCVRIFLVVRQSDENVSEYRISAQGNYATSNRVAVSGLLYSGGNLLVLSPLIIYKIVLFAKVNAPFFWGFIVVLMAIFLPLQGFLNALVYFRPQYLQYKEEKKK